jgi:hypothetical protein
LRINSLLVLLGAKLFDSGSSNADLSGKCCGKNIFIDDLDQPKKQDEVPWMV